MTRIVACWSLCVLVLAVGACAAPVEPDDASSIIDAANGSDAPSAPDAAPPDTEPPDASGVDAAADDADLDAETLGDDVGSDAACGCDDGIACTIDSCTALGCAHQTDYGACPASTYCDPTRGCVGSAVCSGASPCSSPDACIVAHCDAASASCQYTVLDGDHDGAAPVVCGGDDCDDAHANVGPLATDTCNGIDDDCDGSTDEGDSCGGGYSCVAGSCVCGGTECGFLPPLTCADLQTSHGNCGSCGHFCAIEATCTAGACVCPAPTPDVCSSHCVDRASDPANCGSCGHACGPLGACVGGACSCGSPGVLCGTGSGSSCADLATDRLHCGDCSTICTFGAACNAGACSMGATWIAGFGTSTSSYPLYQLEVGPAGDVYVVGEYGTRDLSRSGPALFSTGVGIVHAAPDGTLVSGHTASFRSVIAGTLGGYVLGDWFVSSYAGYPGVTATCPASRRCTLVVGATPDHAVRWTSMLVGSSSATPVFADMERMGDIVVAVGTVPGAFDFGGGSLPSDGTTDGFIYVFRDSDGSFVSATRIAGAPGEVHALADGTVVVTSFYLGAPTVGGVTLPYSGVTSYYYVARYTLAGVASAVHAYTTTTSYDLGSTAADGAFIGVGRHGPTLVDVVDATGTSAGRLMGSSGIEVVGLAAAGSDLVATGTGDGTMIGTLTVPMRTVFLARIDGASAALQDVAYFNSTSVPRMVPYDDDEVVIALVGTFVTLGNVTLRTSSASEYATFVARVRVR